MREFSNAKRACHLRGLEGYALCCIAPALPRTEVCLGASLSLRTRGLRLRTPRESRRQERCPTMLTILATSIHSKSIFMNLALANAGPRA